AFNDFDDFGGTAAVRSWLYGIARHRCLDALKHRRRWSRRFSLSGESHEPADEASPVDERLASRSQGDLLRHCLGKLAPHARIAVLLRYQEDMAYEEMGRICRERAATLQARVARALPVLRRCL